MGTSRECYTPLSGRPRFVGKVTGTHRYIVAIDPGSGEEVWRTKLPHNGAVVPSILIKGRFLYVSHFGHVYCLNRRDGDVVWENDLPKLGYQTVVIAMEGAEGSSPHVAAAADVNRKRRAAGAGGAAGAT